MVARVKPGFISCQLGDRLTCSRDLGGYLFDYNQAGNLMRQQAGFATFLMYIQIYQMILLKTFYSTALHMRGSGLPRYVAGRIEAGDTGILRASND